MTVPEATPTVLSSGIKTKIFLGLHLTTEVRIHLDQSLQWKQDRATSALSPNQIREIHHEGKDYIGLFVEKELPSLEDLNQVKCSVMQQMRKYCEELKVEKLKAALFPQVFLA